MPTAFCPECRALLQFAEPAAGKRGRCIRCKKTVVFEASDVEWGPAEAQDKPRISHYQIIAIWWYTIACLVTFLSVVGAGNGAKTTPGFVVAGCFLLFGYLSTICGMLAAIRDNARKQQPPASRVG
jgi:hypothetical protein